MLRLAVRQNREGFVSMTVQGNHCRINYGKLYLMDSDGGYCGRGFCRREGYQKKGQNEQAQGAAGEVGDSDEDKSGDVTAAMNPEDARGKTVRNCFGMIHKNIIIKSRPG